ncbi:MAG: nitroreductase family protein [Spirochaetia bacterium]
MNQENEEWYQAIELRRSRRKFTGEAIQSEKINQFGELVGKLNQTVDNCRILLVKSHNGSIFSGIRGGYGVIKGAPSYLAFIGKSSHSSSYAKLGYIGEAAVLEATRLKIGTCWVSGTFDPTAAVKDLNLEAEEELVAVSPLGYPLDAYAFSEKMMSGLAGSRKRKPLEAITDGWSVERWPEWAKCAAEAARLAPSAMNRQPWIFRFEGADLAEGGEQTAGGSQPTDGELMVETANSSGGIGSPFSKRLDCGIALRHLVVGAQHSLGSPVSVTFYDSPQVAGVRV